MRLKPERVPDAADGLMRDPCLFCHRASAPMRRRLRFGLQRAPHDPGDLIVFNRARRPRPRQIAQAGQPFHPESLSPRAYRRLAHPNLARHFLIGGSPRASQHDSRADHFSHPGFALSCHLLQGCTFHLAHFQRLGGASAYHAPTLPDFHPLRSSYLTYFSDRTLERTLTVELPRRLGQQPKWAGLKNLGRWPRDDSRRHGGCIAIPVYTRRIARSVFDCDACTGKPVRTAKTIAGICQTFGSRPVFTLPSRQVSAPYCICNIHVIK